MPKAQHRFKRSSAYGKRGEEAYYRRRARLAKRTKLARRHISASSPVNEVREELFRRLLSSKEKPSRILKKIITHPDNLSEKSISELFNVVKNLDLDWEKTRKYEKRAKEDPVEFFKMVFGFEPADNGIIIKTASCDIHLGFSQKNWDLLVKKGFLLEWSVGQQGTKKPIKNEELSEILTFSLSERYGDFTIAEDMYIEENRHHFQNAMEFKTRNYFTQFYLRSIAQYLREEISAGVLHGNPYRWRISRYFSRHKRRLMDQARRQIRTCERELVWAEENKEISQGTREFCIKWAKKDLENWQGMPSEVEQRFQRIERLVKSERFCQLMGEAQRTVPRDVLASTIETNSFRRLEALLPELILKYKKKSSAPQAKQPF